ncbi:uncharacterized protein LOC110040108 isoform X2 [Orbicella faveolata]|uniref:uncharacterized protein LOC110040108 isoform X2 n=1 Tax=Orbicella faveolata TaxID=48498 RepID=UPI0009E36C07|nr:uncharacterized protein LOC110040108 isoform X2 [Orbicella faveolata]
MAFTNLRVDNFTITDSLVFINTNSPSPQDNYAFCQTINFTETFYAPPVVLVTPKRSDNNNNSNQSGSRCNAVTAWVEHTSTTDAQVCVKNYNSDANNKDVITVDYMITGDLDPCIDVTCHYHCLCKAFGPHDARCVAVDRCPSYREPVCSSNGTTHDNECLFRQEMCLLQLNFSVQHPGSCEGFPFQRGRRHMPHIPSLGYSHCEVIRLKPYMFYPDKPLEVQITVNHIDTSDKSYVHDAAVSWIENVSYDRFTTCVMAAGYNERKSNANVTVDWMAYQGGPVGGVAGEVRISQWWTGTTCKAVNFPSGKFSVVPSVFVTAAHRHAGLKRDAASLWIEDVTQSSFKVCLRELQNYAGSHEDVHVKWLAFSSLHKPLFTEHSSVYFANSQHPPADYNNAFCKDIRFARKYNSTPNVFVSANHSSSGGNQQPVHNGITAWVEYINMTGVRVCLKELYGTKYDPLSISYTVLSDVCQPGWTYFGGYCYFTSPACTSWLTAESNCSVMDSDLVTIHNQEENVFIQHRHSGDKSWIGLNDRSVEGSFVWTNKEISSFRFWAPKQPNDWNNEDCVHTLGTRHGYTWNDVPCNNCFNFTCFTDLDECNTNTHNCDVNADCVNTVGSYSCMCKAGYTGDGQTCNDVDECSTSSHSCDVNAVCNNTPASHNCTCKAGYSGDGNTCSDVDECSTNSHGCDVDAVCSNTRGSHTCACKAGYSGDGRTCSDVNECSDPLSVCDVNARCQNTQGSYRCSCKAGFTGDGKSCTSQLYVTTSSSCSNLLTTRSSTSGIIYSNKHGSYSNSMTCHWSLSSNSNLELIFFRLSTESGYDFVNVYDGGSSSDPLIGRYQGTSMPGTITSSSNQLYITFTSDGSSTRSGFAASYHVVDSIRLIGGSTPLIGRVEVFAGGEWGTVCDDGWDINDANVVCRQLGFPQASQAYRGANHGQGTGRIWLDDLTCSGGESYISDCGNRGGWGSHDCSHSQDASVRCSSSIP